MSILGYFLLLLVFILPAVWVFSEFKCERKARLLAGSAAILTSFAVAALVGILERLNSNSWFGYHTKGLVAATVNNLEAGRNTNVLNALKELQESYHPSYENRAGYGVLVSNAVIRMNESNRNDLQYPSFK